MKYDALIVGIILLASAGLVRGDEDKNIIENLAASIKNMLAAEGVKDFTVLAQSKPARVTTRSVNHGEKMLCVRVVFSYQLTYDPRKPANQPRTGTRDVVLIFCNPTSVRSMIDAEVMQKLAAAHGDTDTVNWLGETNGLAREKR